MKTRISTKGQLVLPAELRTLDDIQPGQEFVIERLEPGTYRLVLTRPARNQGLVDWLLQCPEKDFFEPIPSESTDSIGGLND